MIDLPAHVRERAPRTHRAPLVDTSLVSLEVERVRDDRRFRRVANLLLDVLGGS